MRVYAIDWPKCAPVIINIQPLLIVVRSGRRGLEWLSNVARIPVQRRSPEGMSVRVEPLSPLEYLYDLCCGVEQSGSSSGS